MVSIGTNGLSVKFGFCPAAMVTIIVSPIARDTAKMNADTIPDKAAGTTTKVDTSSLVEPNA